MSEGQANDGETPCRILVVGANRQRVQKVIALIDDQLSLEQNMEFIPCVAQFDSYEAETGGSVRYLVNLKAFEKAESRSLLPLFDAAAEATNLNTFPPIAGVAIGIGIEGECDTGLIRAFLKTMMRFPDEETTIPVATVQPNAEFSTMAEELDVYRNLSEEEKANVSGQALMGPGKMAAFVRMFTLKVIRDYSDDVSALGNDSGLADRPEIPNTPETTPDDSATQQATEANITEETLIIDHEKPMYLCRMCRTTLFGIDSLNDHIPAKHEFSYRKQHSASQPSISTCQSMFLDESLPWMGDTNANEGKFSCPNCKTKLGSWNWSGAQCSCGTWVVPAIQIPTSRVDVYNPPTTHLPPGTVLSSLLLRHGPPNTG